MIAKHSIERPRLGLGSFLGYGAGDFAFNLSYGTSLAYSVYFYTDICRIPAAIVATILLVSKIANAMIDPLIGIWLDRRDHGERARPFLLYGAVPFGLALFLSFIPLHADLSIKVMWAGATCFGLSVLYSVLNIPYGILTNLMAEDAESRVKLVTWRFLGANIGLAAISMGTLSAVKLLGGNNAAWGFTLFGSIVGIVTILCCLGTWATSRERVHYQSDRRPIGEILIEIATGKGWLAVTGAMAAATISLSMVYGMATYYAIYVCGGTGVFAEQLIGVMTIFFIIGTVVATPATLRLGVKRAAILFNLAQIPVLLLLSFQHSTAAALVLNALIGLLVGLREPSVYALLSDSIDGDAGAGGKASIGAGYALNSAFIKLAMGLAGAMIGWLLAIGGYEAGASQQTPLVILMIRLGYGVGPAFFAMIAGLLLLRYRSHGRALAVSR